jgi:hypothetical protein
LILAISGAPKSVLRRIERLALIANLTESVLSVAVEQEWKRQELETPVKQPPLDSAHRFGEQGLGIAVPILLRTINMLFGRGSRTLTMGAAISTLIGGFTQRTVMVFAGRKSALRPEDYFRFTQPGAPTAGEGRISMAGEQR